MKVSIIIKALNEEENIARAIETSLEAIKGMKGEVILADSLSTDDTVKIAKKYPIKIVQLKKKEDRSCGMGAELGYRHSEGKYVYILDGDMELFPDFIEKGIEELEKDKKLAGVAGKIVEMTDENIVFKRRKKSQRKIDEKQDKLMMGGLYRREAIEDVGYFSNPYLHAYEESDLGNRLTTEGYRLKRIPVKMVKHYGDKKSSFKIYLDRWKSKYLWGCGEYLRYNLGKKTFWKVVKELKLYLGVILWWLGLFVSIGLSFVYPLILRVYLLITLIFLLLFLIKKLSIKEVIFSLFSWNITALGLLVGFLQRKKDIKKKIVAKKIK